MLFDRKVLHCEVEKDIAKPTGNKYLKKNARKWGTSKGLKVRPNEYENLYEWVGRVGVDEALEFLKSTKEIFIEFFHEQGYDGDMLYELTVKNVGECRGKVIKQESVLKYEKVKDFARKKEDSEKQVGGGLLEHLMEDESFWK